MLYHKKYIDKNIFYYRRQKFDKKDAHITKKLKALLLEKKYFKNKIVSFHKQNFKCFITEKLYFKNKTVHFHQQKL